MAHMYVSNLLCRKYAAKKTKLIIYKLLFIVHVTVKCLLKSYIVV